METTEAVVEFEAFGARVLVEASESIAPTLSLRLPPRAQPVTGAPHDIVYTVHVASSESRTGSPGFDIVRNGEARGYCSDLDAVRYELESDMHFQVALAAKEYLFVHAGVVAYQGRAVVIPGRSRTGKSSLVLALLEAGAAYYSDEYAVVDTEGMVHPYYKPLSERVHDSPWPRLHSLEELGVRGDADPLPVGLTVITRYQPGARWAPEPATSADALMALFDNTVVAKTKPGFAMDLLAKAVRGSVGLAGARGERDDAVADILNATRPPRT